MIRLSFKQATATVMAGFVLGAVALVVGASLATATPPPPVDPPSYSTTLASGSSVTIKKTVNTPAIPPQPDICFLADTTGSMTGALANVKANATAIMNTVLASSPDAQFCAAQYRDIGDTPLFAVGQTVTATVASVQTAINAWSAGGGGDTPEAQLNALTQMAGATPGWRAAPATHVIVWFGDAPGHDPSNGATLASTITALTTGGAGAPVLVIAIPVSGASGLDSTGQATAITAATGGSIQPANPNTVAAAILAGLSNLPVKVTPVATCDTGLTATFNPAEQTVPSGTAATFDETLSVAANAPDGGVLSCTIDFLLDGQKVDGFQQKVAITVPLRATDLSITKTGPAFVQTGGSVTYTLTAKNNGTDPDTNVIVSDTLPAGETLVSATPSQGTCGLPNVTCNLGTLGAGASATVTIVANVTAASGSTLVNTATVTGDRPDTNTANNSSTTSAFAYGVLARGGFVIGDKNAATGTAVTFWGAQWWKLNSLTGGAAPASFKGYALNPAVLACGTNWSTDPGNSAPPPAGPLPAYMAVIVASTITKSGSQISGDTAHIVIVKTNPGYDANPGHAGTGTVFATLC